MKSLLAFTALLAFACVAPAEEWKGKKSHLHPEAVVMSNGDVYFKDKDGCTCYFSKETILVHGETAIVYSIKFYRGEVAVPTASSCATGSCSAPGTQFYPQTYQRGGLFRGRGVSSGSCANGSCR